MSENEIETDEVDGLIIYALKEDSNHHQGHQKKTLQCRYCKTSWPIDYFKDSQQFSSHQHNCKKKRKKPSEDSKPTTTESTKMSEAKERKAKKPKIDSTNNIDQSDQSGKLQKPPTTPPPTLHLNSINTTPLVPNKTGLDMVWSQLLPTQIQQAPTIIQTNQIKIQTTPQPIVSPSPMFAFQSPMITTTTNLQPNQIRNVVFSSPSGQIFAPIGLLPSTTQILVNNSSSPNLILVATPNFPVSSSSNPKPTIPNPSTKTNPPNSTNPNLQHGDKTKNCDRLENKEKLNKDLILQHVAKLQKELRRKYAIAGVSSHHIEKKIEEALNKKIDSLPSETREQFECVRSVFKTSPANPALKHPQIFVFKAKHENSFLLQSQPALGSSWIEMQGATEDVIISDYIDAIRIFFDLQAEEFRFTDHGLALCLGEELTSKAIGRFIGPFPYLRRNSN